MNEWVTHAPDTGAWIKWDLIAQLGSNVLSLIQRSFVWYWNNWFCQIAHNLYLRLCVCWPLEFLATSHSSLAWYSLCMGPEYLHFKSLSPGSSEWNFRWVIFNLISVIDGWGIPCKIALRWMSKDLTHKSSLVQVTAWFHQATSHYLSQWWPSSMSPHGIIRLQWVYALFKGHLSKNEDSHFIDNKR